MYIKKNSINNKIELKIYFLIQFTIIMTTEKSKKNKDNTIDKTKLWNVFDTEVINPDKQKEPLECHHRKSITKDRLNNWFNIFPT